MNNGLVLGGRSGISCYGPHSHEYGRMTMLQIPNESLFSHVFLQYVFCTLKM